ncbi:MAG: hypothetical protein JXB14_08060 [Candidatus Altiarchaeota archaeon]|nr:hypothetical protein [Candidatus Altiarchaeota archaeon]
MEFEIQPQRATIRSVSNGFQKIVLEVEEVIVSQSPGLSLVPPFTIPA